MKLDYLPALRFKALTRFYDPIIRLTTRERVAKQSLIKCARIPDDATVIDLGCGTGTLTIWLKQQYPSVRMIGLDADPNILEYARTKARAAGVDIEFVDGYANALPFDDGSAERVVSSLFFHHLQPADKRMALSEVFRVLSPGGELHVSDWGAPTNLLMRALFLQVRILDGFPNTHDNVKGYLPKLTIKAGARRVEQHSSFNTVFGTLTLFQATK